MIYRAEKTVDSALRWGAGQLEEVADQPYLEAERLLARVLEAKRIQLLTHPERELPPSQLQRYRDMVHRRASGEPLPYVLEQAAFLNLTFVVSPDVLIPRPETELLVERGLAWLRQSSVRDPVVVDVGAGSGCIAVSLAAALPTLRVVAIDISTAALTVARKNAQHHDVAARVTNLQADLLTCLQCPIDLILSNPPYVSETEWHALPGTVRREPAIALLAGPDGLTTIRRLLHQTRRRLAPGGCLLMEIGERQGNAALALARSAFAAPEFAGTTIQIYRDLAGRSRVLEVFRS